MPTPALASVVVVVSKTCLPTLNPARPLPTIAVACQRNRGESGGDRIAELPALLRCTWQFGRRRIGLITTTCLHLLTPDAHLEGLLPRVLSRAPGVHHPSRRLLQFVAMVRTVADRC